MSDPKRGEVWWGELPDAGRRPFLVMTRDVAIAIPILKTLLAAPVTRTVRGLPTELRLGRADGMPTDCAAGFDNLRVVPKAYLVERECALGPERMLEACRALRTAMDCQRYSSRAPTRPPIKRSAAQDRRVEVDRLGPRGQNVDVPTTEIVRRPSPGL